MAPVAAAAANQSKGSGMTHRIAGLAPLLLVVSGSLMYHIAAKSIPKAFDPVASLIGLYATALVGGVLIYAAARPAASSFAWSRLWHPTIAAVGLGALMIEIGFLLAYRGAWPVSTASVATNGLVAVLLVAVGATFFGEAVTPLKVIGVLLCLLGVILLQR
jgi:drug/metabolite transporter (DMT)-like permease